MKFDKNVIEVYKKRVYNELLIAKRAKIEELKNNDPYGKFVNEINKKYIDLARKNGEKIEDDFKFASTYKYTDKTVEAIEEVEKEFKDKMDDRDRIIEEVTALEMLCDTVEDYTALYRKFGILDDNGKIYDYKK